MCTIHVISPGVNEDLTTATFKVGDKVIQAEAIKDHKRPWPTTVGVVDCVFNSLHDGKICYAINGVTPEGKRWLDFCREDEIHLAPTNTN